MVVGAEGRDFRDHSCQRRRNLERLPYGEATVLLAREKHGRGGQDRTADFLLPKQAPYRWATPRDNGGNAWVTGAFGTPGEGRTLVSGSGGRHSIH